MTLSPLAGSPYIRPLPKRVYETQAMKEEHKLLNYLRFWPYCDYDAPTEAPIDLAPSLAGNWYCRNDMDLRAGLVWIASAWLWRAAHLESVIIAHRRARQAIGFDRCSCGRPHWLDPEQHDATVALVERIHDVMQDLGARDVISSLGHQGWSVALPPALGLPPRIVGYWDHSVRLYYSAQQMMHICVTRSEPCQPPTPQAPTFRVPLDLALAVSSIAARHGGRDATVAVAHIDSDTGVAEGLLRYVPVGQIGLIGTRLAEHWKAAGTGSTP
jgi:hypothetical protein